MNERRLLAIILGFSAFRLAVAPGFQLFPQEAYYDLYARHLALSYFDHPPMIGWLLWCFTAVFGQHAWVLRLSAFCLSAITQLLLWKLIHEAVAPERRVPALLLLVTPLMSVVSLISTPDVPLLLFSSATLLGLWRAFQGPEKSRPLAWLAAGVAAGLAFDSKYTALFLPAGAFLLLLDPLHRRQLRSPWPYLAALVAAAVTAPVWIWNARHDFVSLRFQTVARAEMMTHFRFRHFGSLLTTQTFLLGVLFVILLWEALRLPWRLRKIPAERRAATVFFAAFSVPPILILVLLSAFLLIKANWLEPFYLAGIPFVALSWSRPERLVMPTLGWSVLAQALAAVELLLAPFPIRTADTCFGWRELAAAVAPLRSPDEFVFSGESYKTAAELEFYGGQKVYAGDLIGRPAFEYPYLGDDLSKLRGKDAIFVDPETAWRDEEPALRPPRDLAARFASVTQLEPLLVRRNGRLLRKFWLWHCHDYLGPP